MREFENWKRENEIDGLLIQLMGVHLKTGK